MRSALILPVCFLALGLSGGCGQNRPVNAGSRAQNEQPDLNPSKTPAVTTDNAEKSSDDRPLIVAFGDSLTAGVSGESYPSFLQSLLDQHHYEYRVENQGVSGDTTTDGLGRIGTVIAAKPAVVILEFGGNDGLRGVPLEVTRKNLAEMIRQLRAATIPTTLAGITLPPNYGEDYVKPFTEMFPTLARQYRLRYLPFLLLHVYNKPGLMQPDGIHPSEEGNRVVAADVFQLIQPLLDRPHAKSG